MRSVLITIDSRINNQNITYCLTFKEEGMVIGNATMCNKDSVMEWMTKWLTNQMQGEDILFIPFDEHFQQST